MNMIDLSKMFNKKYKNFNNDIIKISWTVYNKKKNSKYTKINEYTNNRIGTTKK